MGSPIRSEIWALIAPDTPGVAASYAYEDAIVDHAGGEGVYGELFHAAVESAAFVEEDPLRLIDIGLAAIPDTCSVAAAVSDTVDWYHEGHDWQETRALILEEHGSTDMIHAPQNIAFVVLGLLYGNGFGDSLLKCVNCGYDTDSSGATLGSILGILVGKNGVPDRWVDPIGDDVITRAEVRGFPSPGNLDELTERTLALAKRVQAVHDLPVEFTTDPDPSVDPTTLTDWVTGHDPRRLWDRAPNVIEYSLPQGSRSSESLHVRLEFGVEIKRSRMSPQRPSSSSRCTTTIAGASSIRTNTRKRRPRTSCGTGTAARSSTSPRPSGNRSSGEYSVTPTFIVADSSTQAWRC